MSQRIGLFSWLGVPAEALLRGATCLVFVSMVGPGMNSYLILAFKICMELISWMCLKNNELWIYRNCYYVFPLHWCLIYTYKSRSQKQFN